MLLAQTNRGVEHQQGQRTKSKHMKIEGIPTDIFNRILNDHMKSGWQKISEQTALDTWVNYGKIVLSKDQVTLFFEWDNWFEGWVEGPEEEIKRIYKYIGKVQAAKAK